MSESAGREAVRIIRVRLPSRESTTAGGFGQRELLVGVALASAMAAGLVFKLLAPSILVSAPRALLVGANLLIVAGFVTLLIVDLVDRALHVRRLRFPQHRQRRLDWVSSREDAAKRVPHRLAEIILRERRTRRRTFERALRCLPPGVVLAMERGHARVARSVEPSSILFEPVAIGAPAFAGFTDTVPGAAIDARRASDHRWGHRNSARFEIALASILGAALALHFFVGVPMDGWGLAAIGLVMLASRYALTALMTRDRFVMPGGIILRDDVFWRRGQQVRVATATESPMILDVLGGFAYVDLQGRVAKVKASRAHLPQILAAWQSTARTPTLEEVKTFLGATDDVDA